MAAMFFLYILYAHGWNQIDAFAQILNDGYESSNIRISALDWLLQWGMTVITNFLKMHWALSWESSYSDAWPGALFTNGL